MICPVCFGRKYDFKKDGNSGYFVECKKCHGTGKIETTNEEWFCALSTEEKARWFCDHIGCSNCRFYGKCLDEQMGQDLWIKWLKQPHT